MCDSKSQMTHHQESLKAATSRELLAQLSDEEGLPFSACLCNLGEEPCESSRIHLFPEPCEFLRLLSLMRCPTTTPSRRKFRNSYKR